MYRRGLAILEDNQSLFIARGEAEHIVSTAVRVGAYLPLYCSATGPVLLGGRSDGEIRQRLGQRPIIARTPHGLSTTADILSTIRAAAECGYAISDEELALGLRSMAVPVFGGERSPCGGERQRGICGRQGQRSAEAFSACAFNMREADFRNARAYPLVGTAICDTTGGLQPLHG
jgi:DNA-binding IclR family transcriptional regulator